MPDSDIKYTEGGIVCRTCCREDTAGASRLWQEVFGDSAEYIDAFYTALFKDAESARIDRINSEDKPPLPEKAAGEAPGCLFTAEINGSTVGMVNAVPICLKTGSRYARGAYIYGACVKKEYRGAGIFKKLLKKAEQNRDFCVLIPENDNLYPMYEHLGYENPLYTSYPFPGNPEEATALKAYPFDGDAERLYRLYLENAVGFIKGRSFFELTVSEFTGSEICYLQKDGEICGYALTKSSPIPKIYEISCKYPLKKGIISILNKTRRRAALFRPFAADCAGVCHEGLCLFGEELRADS